MWRQIFIVAIYAVLSRNLLCCHLRCIAAKSILSLFTRFCVEKIYWEIVLEEQKGQIWGMRTNANHNETKKLEYVTRPKGKRTIQIFLLPNSKLQIDIFIDNRCLRLLMQIKFVLHHGSCIATVLCSYVTVRCKIGWEWVQVKLSIFGGDRLCQCQCMWGGTEPDCWASLLTPVDHPTRQVQSS